MTIEEIIKQVRYSIDEESGSTDFVDTYMNNIIVSKINDAIRWVCLYADSSLLGGSGSDTGDNPTIRSYSYNIEDGQSDVSEEYPPYSWGTITLPYDFLALVRIRVSSWRRGVSTTITEDSDAYLMQSDDTAKADTSCPVVALIEDYPNRLEVYPPAEDGDNVSFTIAVAPKEVDINSWDETTNVEVPPKLRSAFIYYLAYLVMCAYNDANKATLMLGIAKAQIGGSSTQTNAG